MNTDLNTLDNKVVQLKENRNKWKTSSDTMTGKYNSEVTAHNSTKATLKTTQTNLTNMTKDRDSWKGKYDDVKDVYQTITAKYSELDALIPTLTPGTYNLVVDCTGVAASEFKGTLYQSGVPAESSPFGRKLQAALDGVYFNLTPINVGSDVTEAISMFYNCSNLTSIDTSVFTKVTNANQMFWGCSNLTSIDTKAFTSVVSAEYMFMNCSSLTSIDTKVFTKVTNAYGMFSDCSSLTSIDTSAFTKVINANYMFERCSNLKEVLGTSVFIDVVNTNEMFFRCSSLKSIDTSGFNSRRIYNDGFMFTGCESLTNIIWGDDFRPKDNSIFNHSSAPKTIIASEDSKAWIEANASYIHLTNYTFLEPYAQPFISVPSFTFNGITCKNVDFVFMGFAQSAENKGKAIYMSTDCLPEVQASMNSLLTGSTNGDVGTGTIGKAAATSLDSAILAITNKHLQEYTRTYDGRIHREKIFFPLECEVFGRTDYSADKSTLSKYPQWEGFKKSPDSKIKYIDYQQNKYKAFSWWEANKARNSGTFCNVDYDGWPIYNSSSGGYYGCGVAFCL